MIEESESQPDINIHAETTSKDIAAILEQLPIITKRRSAPPTEALKLLYKTACQCSGGSQAARYFLFWLAALSDPTGYNGDGGLELRRLDATHKKAALEVLAWWAGPTQSDDPLLHILNRLLDRFGSRSQTETRERNQS